LPSLAKTWGTSPAERAEPYPCDRLLDPPYESAHRVIDVAAPAPVLYRWLCQLRVAPYSYDLLDNLGRRSPRELTPGLDRLEIGQRFMTVFELAEFERDRHLTLILTRMRRVFGDLAVTYRVRPRTESGSRFLVKLVYRLPGPPLASRAYGFALPWGDLVMMRKQLRTLAALAERDAVSGSVLSSATA
jgi:hypothetical protein